MEGHKERLVPQGPTDDPTSPLGTGGGQYGPPSEVGLSSGPAGKYRVVDSRVTREDWRHRGRLR